MEAFRRKSPEEILQSIQALHKGRLKLVIGPFRGAGKTYQMLLEGHTLLKQGIDVVFCTATSLRHQETMEQLGELEQIEGIAWMRNGTLQKDLDLEAIRKRRPEVVLIDELAHQNRPQALLPTRLQEIEELLSQGISVITTVNVFELHGYAQWAQQLTGMVIRQTVSSRILDMADELRLIDVTPETILARLADGTLVTEHPEAAWHEPGHLAKLRELALRLVAEEVNERLVEHRKEQGLGGPSGASEHILVSIQYHWNGSIYIRRAQQISKRLNGRLSVVTFVHAQKPLTPDQETFKSSLLKLVHKLQAGFEELQLPSRRQIARALVDYAHKHGVTRIVLGHSRQSTWQELIRGSVVHALLDRLQYADLYFMADTAENYGERILPAPSVTAPAHHSYRRLSGLEIQERIHQITRGKFKVYIGAAPGVGKTYTMLKEGNLWSEKGIKVVVGFLETHGRQETADQVGRLPVLPRKVIAYRGALLEELDVSAILECNPEVVLIDELAHSNVPGSSNQKRYQDIQDILNAGISVISTMNVQHLESLQDRVEHLTGVKVRETVPDGLLQLADEVQLVDVAPDALRQRIREGKVYAMDKVEQALQHFFKMGNLIALRELALRELADDVDERLEAWEEGYSLRGPWRGQEAILVVLTPNEHAERLIRHGFRIAFRLKASWRVLLVTTQELTAEQKQRCLKLEELSERLGGRFEVLQAKHRREAVRELLYQARACCCTQIVIGHTPGSGGSGVLSRSLVKPLLKHARHLDILVVLQTAGIHQRIMN
ncbi:universal stress family protein [Paenibacillus algicola]|uniref:Universal stress family protein n=1 Tax=Paenibacillus algicola TaxID=2565926 RepID=A0A4P8XPJ7_9BACL|nr:histidine kinase [Paenibacillus algicola]QCT04786.1 universal stress family protein [Paenibacillus algicola]